VCVQCVSDCACVCFCILSFIHSFNHFMFIILELSCFIESHLGLDWCTSMIPDSAICVLLQ